MLGVGYSPQEYEAERDECLEHGIEFDFADTAKAAIKKLHQRDYVCIAIRSEYITYEEVLSLRKVRQIPTIILPQTYTVAERYACAHFSAIQYIRASGHQEIAALGSANSLQCYLEMLPEKREPLTIVTVKDLSFCLEHRSVEIRGQEINLTEKEFDILALLLSNPQKVFTYETIMDAVWHEDVSFYSPKAITTHISNLRRKLKTEPDVPEYIKSVRGVGYKFNR